MQAERDVEIEGLARQALPLFGVSGDASVQFVKYRENHVFHIRTADGEWALKLHRPGYRTDDEITSEAAMLESLSAAGVRVVNPVRGRDGQHLVHVREAASGALRQATLQRWIGHARPLGDSPHIFDGVDRPATRQVKELGRLMARLHAHSERNGAPTGYDRPQWDAAGLVGPRALWGTASDLPMLAPHERDVLVRAEHRLVRELATLPRDRNSYGPIHADLTVENVLVDDEGLILIDFDDSGHGWYLFDLATTYFFCSHHPESAAILGELVDGYLGERTLSVSECAAWHPLLLARSLSYLAWGISRPGDPATVYHERVLLPWILDAAERFLFTGSTGWDEPHTPSDPRRRTPRGRSQDRER